MKSFKSQFIFDDQCQLTSK